MKTIIVIAIWVGLGLLMRKLGGAQEEEAPIDLDAVLSSSRRKRTEASPPKETLVSVETEWDRKFRRKKEDARQTAEARKKQRAPQPAPEEPELRRSDSLTGHERESVPDHVRELKARENKFRKDILHHVPDQNEVQRLLAKREKFEKERAARQRKVAAENKRTMQAASGGDALSDDASLVTAMLSSPNGFRAAILMHEILGPPRAFRAHGADDLSALGS